jgi:MSHA biogenesis protein MshO
MRIPSRQAAFSLLELILVIVLLGVMAGGAGLLITTPIEAYNDQLRRQQLVDQAEMALRQIARDVRRALPNSIRTRTVGAVTALEMVNTIDGARYRDENQSGLVDADDILEFAGSDTSFNFLGQLNFLGGALSSNQRMVIYNTAPGNIYSDAISDNNSGIITSTMTGLDIDISSTSVNYPNEHRVTMTNPFSFTQRSPGQRAFFVDGPISYVCDLSAGNNNITRYSGYDYQNPQPVGTPVGVVLSVGLVVTKLSVCNINYVVGTASPSRGGIVTLEITVTESGESITLLHQVHVDNVP